MRLLENKVSIVFNYKPAEIIWHKVDRFCDV